MNITLYRNPYRALTAWPGFYRPVSLLEDIDQLAREFWTSWEPSFSGATLVPHTDMYEEKDHLVIKTELPGITEKDLEVTLEGDVLTIKAERKEEVTEDATHHTGSDITANMSAQCQSHPMSMGIRFQPHSTTAFWS